MKFFLNCVSFQMLNCCIERKVARETRSPLTSAEEEPMEEEDQADAAVLPPTGESENLEQAETPADDDVVMTTKHSDKTNESSDEDDEFYECIESESSSNLTQMSADETQAEKEETTEANPKEEDIDGNHDNNTVTASVASESPDGAESVFKDTFTHQPEGRLRPCGDLHLLNSEAALYIPITQEPSPMTEDMLEEHAEVLAKYGPANWLTLFFTNSIVLH